MTERSLARSGLETNGRDEYDLSINYPLEEELLAAVQYALDWFEAWEQHAPDECIFGGEHAVMKKLRRAIHLAKRGRSVMESRTNLTAFGRLLEEMMDERGVSGPDELAQRATEAGYPVASEVLVGHMHDYHYHPDDLNVVRGPAEVLNLGKVGATRLAVSYLFNR